MSIELIHVVEQKSFQRVFLLVLFVCLLFCCCLCFVGFVGFFVCLFLFVVVGFCLLFCCYCFLCVLTTSIL